MCSVRRTAVFNMPRRVTVQEALLQLQDISAECSYGEYSDSEPNDLFTDNIEEAELESSEEGSAANSASEDDDSHSQSQVRLVRKKRNCLETLPTSHVQRGRLQQQNILNFKPGPTAFAAKRIIESSLFLAFVFCSMRQC